MQNYKSSTMTQIDWKQVTRETSKWPKEVNLVQIVRNHAAGLTMKWSVLVHLPNNFPSRETCRSSSWYVAKVKMTSSPGGAVRTSDPKSKEQNAIYLRKKKCPSNRHG